MYGTQSKEMICTLSSAADDDWTIGADDDSTLGPVVLFTGLDDSKEGQENALIGAVESSRTLEKNKQSKPMHTEQFEKQCVYKYNNSFGTFSFINDCSKLLF